MKGDIERRRSRRMRVDAERIEADVELIWKDEAGQRQFECGRIVDYSETGAAIVCPQPLSPSSSLILRARGMGIIALSEVRNCSWGKAQYRLGVHFLDKVPAVSTNPDAEPDYEEVLRAGASGQFERVEKLYRSLAFRYHPDNRDTGDSETFLRMKEAFRILSPSQPRHVDSAVSRPAPALCGPDAYREQRGRRLAVLGTLYRKRADDFRNATLSVDDLQNLTGMGTDEMGFVLWYLLEKGAVSLSGYSSDYAISAAGVDLMETVSLRD